MDVLHLFPLLLSLLWMSVVSGHGDKEEHTEEGKNKDENDGLKDVINITAEPGKNVNLTCRATKNSEVEVVRLIRHEETIFLYRNDKVDETVQHPEFKGRFSLQSLSTADGEVNVTLSNVTEKDNGTYLCKVRKDQGDYLNTINHLHVAPPGDKEEHTEEGKNKDENDGLKGGALAGLIAGLVAVLIVAAVIVAMIVRKKRRTPPNETENDVGIPLRDQNTSSPS